ncbi:MAG: insulinase family protein, partial [Acidobacteria bacterium]|nr:insulinase family protein [Acidobacteriota bacterium]
MRKRNMKAMLRKYLISSVALLLLWTVNLSPAARVAAQTTAAQETKTTAASTPQPQTITQFTSAQAALVTEFEVNGLKVLVKRRTGSQTVAAGLFLRGGSRNITDKNAGIEDLMLDVATESGTAFPRERLRAETSRMGTVISSSVSYDYSALSLTSTRENFDRSLEIFTDVALHPSFAPDDFKRVQTRKLISLRDDTDTPDSYIQELQNKMIYAGHPYANDPNGTAETVGKLTVEDVRRYHTQMMQTSRLLLVIVGDLDPAMIKTRVAATFGKLPRGNYQPEPVQQLSFAAPTVEITQRALPTNYIQGVFAAPPPTADDIYALKIAASILNQLVYQEVRVERNLSYAPEAFLSSQGANIGGISVTAVDANQAVRVMLEQISFLQRRMLLPEVIRDMVAGYLTNYYLRQETNAAQAAELAQYELIGGGWRNS